MKRVLLGLGSNKSFDDKSSVELLGCACHDLAHLLENVKFSSVYKTKAMYVEDQNDFYNMAALGFMPDNADALELLKTIHQIEAKYGRDRTKEIRFGPRSIDIDIELFGEEIINLPELQIPHIRILERAFVMIPALEILEKVADCKIRKKYEDSLASLERQGEIGGIQMFLSAKDFIPFTGGSFNGPENK